MLSDRKRGFTVLNQILILLLMLVIVLPSVIMLSTSLKKYEDSITWPPQLIPKDLQLSNFSDVWSGKYNVRTGFKNSLIISSSTMIICILLGSVASYGLSRFEFKGKKAFLFILLLTQMFSPVVFLIPIYRVFIKLNLMNTYSGLIISNAAFSLPMTVWLMTGYFSVIPKDVEEAALLDGCNRLQAIFKIIVPMAAPGIISAGLYAFILTWNDLIFSLTFVTKPEMRTLSLMLTDMSTSYETYWHYIAAASVIAVLPVTILFLIIQKHLITNVSFD